MFDYVLLLQEIPCGDGGHDDLCRHDSAVHLIEQIVEGGKDINMLHFRTISRYPLAAGCREYDDYVLEMPHEVVEDVVLQLKREQQSFNVVLTELHDPAADWKMIIESTDRVREVPVVRVRTLFGH